MQVARRALNSALELGLVALANAPDKAVSNAARLLEATLGRWIALPETCLSPPAWRQAFDILLRSVISTPYGAGFKFVEPLMITLSTSKYCPLGCANCYSNSQPDKTLAHGDQFIRSCRAIAESRTPFVVITGGEPFLHPQLTEGANILLSAGKLVSIATNLPLRPEHFAHIEERQRLTLILALWGERHDHDSLRGKGSYDRMISNAHLARSFGVGSSLMIVVNEANERILAEAECLVRECEFNLVWLSRKIIVGRHSDSRELAGYCTQREFRARAERLRPFCRRLVFDMPEYRMPRRTTVWSRVFGLEPILGCGAGTWVWHLDGEGRGFPCAAAEGSYSASAVQPNYLEGWRIHNMKPGQGVSGCKLEKSLTRP